MTEKTKFRMVCASCGSDSVTTTATAEWSLEEQRWVVGDIIEHMGFCSNCDSDVQIVEREVGSFGACLDIIEEGVELADSVVENWSRGDLAGAVNGLEEWAHAAKALLPQESEI